MQQSQKWNRANVINVLLTKKLIRQFKAIFEKSNSPKTTDLLTLIQVLSVQAGLFTRCLCSLKQSQNSNRAIVTNEKTPKKLTKHFKAIFEKSNSPETTDLLTLILMFSVQAGPHVMFQVDAAESAVEQSKYHQRVNFRKVD